MTGSRAPLPELGNEAEEREFWQTHDATDVVPEAEWTRSGARPRQTTTFAIRLDQADIERIRALARARGIGPTQLARSWLLERLRLEQAVGELANPDADEHEIQIRRKVMDDLAQGIPDIVAGALLAFGIGAVVGQAVSKKRRAAARAEASGATPKRSKAASSPAREEASHG
jgi:hypothetical protein